MTINQRESLNFLSSPLRRQLIVQLNNLFDFFNGFQVNHQELINSSYYILENLERYIDVNQNQHYFTDLNVMCNLYNYFLISNFLVISNENNTEINMKMLIWNEIFLFYFNF